MDMRQMTYEQLSEWVDLVDPVMDDYPYVIDLAANRYHIGVSALRRFALSSNEIDLTTGAMNSAVLPQDLPHLQHELGHVAAGETDEHNLQYRWVDQNGNPVWINCRGRVVNRSAEHILMLGCINDISRTEHTESLRGSVMRMVKDGIYTDVIEIDLENDWCVNLYHSEQKYKIPGFSGAYSGMLAYAAAHTVFPDDCAHYRSFMDPATMADRLAGGRRIQADFRKLSADGSWGWSRYQLMQDGAKVLWTVQDIQAENGLVLPLLADDSLPAQESADLIRRVQHGIDHGEFFFMLQPQYCDLDNKVVGFEALIRWTDPEKGIISPGSFIPQLEKNGYITALDCHIWKKVCIWLASVIARGIRPVPVSINVSHVDIESIDVAAYIEFLLKKYNLPAGLIKAEITESTYARSMDRVNETVRGLRHCGVSVLMDDFGSGYSSLNMLRDLSFDVIKLDCAFNDVRRNSEKGDKILDTVRRMAAGIDLAVVVEGVETEEQLEHLRELGFTYVQGYVYSRPVRIEDCEAMLEDGTSVSYSGLRAQADIMTRVTRELQANRRMTEKLLSALTIAHMNSWEWSPVTGDLVCISAVDQQFFAGITTQKRGNVRIIRGFPGSAQSINVSPEAARALEDYCNRILHAMPGEVVRTVVTFRAPDGQDVVTHIHGTMQYGADGRPQMAAGFYRRAADECSGREGQ